MDFFDGFKWALPKSFTDSIANCRFEEGDIIYDTKLAYQKWGKALEKITRCIKIKYPRRSSRPLLSKHKSVQLENWYSDVRIEFININAKTKQQFETTQGVIFSLFWKDDFKLLELELKDAKSIPIPLFLKDIKKNQNRILKEAIPRCREIASGNTFFIMPYDPTNDISRKKHNYLLESLKTEFNYKLIQLSPEQAGFERWDNIFPAIKTDLFVFENIDPIHIGEILKKVLYKPTKGTQKAAFKLETHGILMNG